MRSLGVSTMRKAFPSGGGKATLPGRFAAFIQIVGEADTFIFNSQFSISFPALTIRRQMV